MIDSGKFGSFLFFNSNSAGDLSVSTARRYSVVGTAMAYTECSTHGCWLLVITYYISGRVRNAHYHTKIINVKTSKFQP